MSTSQKPTILNVNSHALFGGAERVVTSLHQEYLLRGQDSWFAVGKAEGAIPNMLEVPNDAERGAYARLVLSGSQSLAEKSHKLFDPWWMASRSLKVLAEPLRYLHIARGYEDFDFPGSHHLPSLPPSPPEVVHLHNLHGSYFDLRALPELTKVVPTIATLHDAWLLTGHCVHPFDCQRWKTGCGECPYLRSYVPLPVDKSAQNHEIKREILAASQLRVATPSHWLMNMVHESPMADSLVETRVIPNGVDTTIFRPGNRLAAREELGLPADASIVLFSARNIETSPWKDFETLVSALSAVSERHGKELLLVTLGAVTSDRLRGLAQVLPVEFVKEPERVAQYYRAADLYVHAARAENLPLAIIEAMACGTPVVATAVGGIPELVEHESEGLLTPVGDAHAFAQAIERVLGNREMAERMAEAATTKASGQFSLKQQADAYLEWYQELLEATQKSS